MVEKIFVLWCVMMKKGLSLIPIRAWGALVCDFKVEVVPHNERFEPCWGNMREVI